MALTDRWQASAVLPRPRWALDPSPPVAEVVAVAAAVEEAAVEEAAVEEAAVELDVPLVALEEAPAPLSEAVEGAVVGVVVDEAFAAEEVV